MRINGFFKDCSSAAKSGPKFISIFFRNRRFRVEVADSFFKKASGLSGRDDMAADGMVFIFRNNGRHGFWMRGMRFSIDIIWLDSDMKVVHILGNAEPCRSVFGCKTVRPSKNARYVVELKAGTAKSMNMRIGSRFRF